MKPSRRRPERADTNRSAAAAIDAPPNHQGWWLVGLAALLAATVIVPSESAPLGCGAMALVLGWLLLLLAWSAWGLVQGRLSWRGGPALAVLALFLAWIAVSAVATMGRGQPRATINMMWQWIGLGCTFLLVRQLAATAVQRRALVGLYLALSVALSAVGYSQYFWEFPAQRERFKSDPQSVLRDAGMAAEPGTPQWESFRNRLESKEPFATYALANSLAGFLSPWLVVALGIGLMQRTENGSWQRLPWLAALTAIFIAGCWLLTKSRSAALATASGIALLAIYGRRSGWRPDWRWLLGLAAAAVLLPIGAYVVGGLDAFVLLEASKSMLYRVQYWRASAAMIADYPLFGCGPGNFQQYYTAYKLPEASETVAEPHNLAFEIWSTVGTPAILLFVILLLVISWQAWRGQQRAASVAGEGGESAEQPATGLGMIAGGGLAGCLLGYLICAVLEGYWPTGSLVLVGLPIGAVVFVLWFRWMQRGQLSVAIPSIAVMVVLVNLLAAGGIGFASVAQTLWVLLALVLAEAEVSAPVTELTRRGTAILAGVAVVGVLIMAQTAYLPVLRARNHLLAGDALAMAGRLEPARQQYRQASAADPYSPDGWERLVALDFAAWMATGDRGEEQRFRESSQAAVLLNPRSMVLRKQLGEWWLAAYRRSQDAAHLAEAIAAFRVATGLYPNYNLGHAQLSWLLHLAGKSAEAASEAELALELDASNPHGEQKLARQRIADPGLPGTSQPPPPGDKTAEQVMLELRNYRNLDNS